MPPGAECKRKLTEECYFFLAAFFAFLAVFLTAFFAFFAAIVIS
jgi:hypothetical protein